MIRVPYCVSHAQAGGSSKFFLSSIWKDIQSFIFWTQQLVTCNNLRFLSMNWRIAVIEWSFLWIGLSAYWCKCQQKMSLHIIILSVHDMSDLCPLFRRLLDRNDCYLVNDTNPIETVMTVSKCVRILLSPLAWFTFNDAASTIDSLIQTDSIDQSDDCFLPRFTSIPFPSLPYFLWYMHWLTLLIFHSRDSVNIHFTIRWLNRCVIIRKLINTQDKWHSNDCASVNTWWREMTKGKKLHKEPEREREKKRSFPKDRQNLRGQKIVRSSVTFLVLFSLRLWPLKIKTHCS